MALFGAFICSTQNHCIRFNFSTCCGSKTFPQGAFRVDLFSGNILMLLIANDVKLICKRFLSQVVVFFFSKSSEEIANSVCFL